LGKKFFKCLRLGKMGFWYEKSSKIEKWSSCGMEDVWIFKYNGVWMNGNGVKCLNCPPRVKMGFLHFNSPTLKTFGSIKVENGSSE